MAASEYPEQMPDTERELGNVPLAPIGPGLRRGVTGNLALSPAVGSGNVVPFPGSGSGVAPSDFNADYQPSPFNLAAWHLITIFSFDALRKTLQIQNTSGNNMYIIFRDISATDKDYSAAADQAQLTSLSASAFRLGGGAFYEPFKPPRTSVTIFTLGAAATGVAVQGA